MERRETAEQFGGHPIISHDHQREVVRNRRSLLYGDSSRLHEALSIRAVHPRSTWPFAETRRKFTPRKKSACTSPEFRDPFFEQVLCSLCEGCARAERSDRGTAKLISSELDRRRASRTVWLLCRLVLGGIPRDYSEITHLGKVAGLRVRDG